MFGSNHRAQDWNLKIQRLNSAENQCYLSRFQFPVGTCNPNTEIQSCFNESSIVAKWSLHNLPKQFVSSLCPLMDSAMNGGINEAIKSATVPLPRICVLPFVTKSVTSQHKLHHFVCLMQTQFARKRITNSWFLNEESYVGHPVTWRTQRLFTPSSYKNKFNKVFFLILFPMSCRESSTH